MEKAVIKTLIYANIFDYPLKIFEIHRWLIGRKITLRQVEKMVGKLCRASRIRCHGEYFFLNERAGLVGKRMRKERQSIRYFYKARILSRILKLIPWIKLVGISGGLALNNAGKSDDIDLFIITCKNRLWISRILSLGLLSLIGQRRKVREKGREIAGKLCLNILLEEDKLEQKNKDIFVAHEVLQMKPLWQRNGVYSKYLADNEWVFKFLPNWIASDTSLRAPPRTVLVQGKYPWGGVKRRSNRGWLNFISRLPRSLWPLAMTEMENLAKKFQLKIMQKPTGSERIEDGALYFHPEDCRSKVLAEYKIRLKKILSIP